MMSSTSTATISIRTNHVIFLGAGASYTSGYPIGRELGLLMASRSHFAAKAMELYGNDAGLTGQLLEYFDRFTESVELFRHGGFATVDEFSKLASGSYPEHEKVDAHCFVTSQS